MMNDDLLFVSLYCPPGADVNPLARRLMAKNPEVLRGTKEALKMVRDIFEQGGTPR